MPFLTQGKTNWKYILIVLILAVIVGGGILWCVKRQEVPPVEFPEIKKPEKVEEEKLPYFEDFPVSEEFKGSPISPDFSSNPDALLFITRITEGAKEGPNFAGHYTIIEWGCGTECQSGVVVDAKTGTIYSTHLPWSAFGREFQIDSYLLIINPPETIESRYPYYPYDQSGKLPAWVYSEYYKWENNQFALIYKYKPEKIIEDETADWKIYRNEEYGYEFKYPEELNQIYTKTHPSKWPPMVTVESVDPDFVCKEFESQPGYGPPREQKEILLNSSKYCLLTIAEGGAGSVYINYKYITNRNNRQLTIEFTLISPNCGVFYGLDNKMEECEKELNDFFKEDIGPTILIDKILSTFRFLE